MAELLVELGVPVNYQLIPDAIPDTAVDDLIAFRRKHADLVRFNQHGFTHETVIDGMATPAEFSGRPGRAAQRTRIAAGRDRLAELLGDAHDDRVFTPPNHAYDADTLTVLGELGFDIVSAGYRTGRAAHLAYRIGRLARRTELAGRGLSRHPGTWPSGVRELSVAVNVDMDQMGARVTRSAADLIAQFDTARAVTPVVGVMLHHQCWVETERVTKTAAMTALIDHIRAQPGCRIRTIEQCADELHGRGSTGS